MTALCVVGGQGAHTGRAWRRPVGREGSVRADAFWGLGWGGQVAQGKRWLGSRLLSFPICQESVRGWLRWPLSSLPVFLRPGSPRICLTGKGRLSQNGGSPRQVCSPREPGAVRR